MQPTQQATSEIVTRAPEPPSSVLSGPQPDPQDDPFTWDSETLIAFVVEKIRAWHGPFPRFPEHERRVLGGFHRRWGQLAGPIAALALETSGYWKGAPISVDRFAPESDAYFAEVILDQSWTNEAPAEGSTGVSISSVDR